MKQVWLFVAASLVFFQTFSPLFGQESAADDPLGAVFAKKVESALRSGDLSVLRPLLCRTDISPELQARQDQSFKDLMSYLHTKGDWWCKPIEPSELPKGESNDALNLQPLYGIEVVNFGANMRCRFSVGIVGGKYRIAESSYDSSHTR